MKPEQWTYVRARIAGKKPMDAFDVACPDASPHMRKKTPYMWEKKKEIREAITLKLTPEDMQQGLVTREQVEEARKREIEVVREAGMTRAEKRVLLKKIANDAKKSPMARIAAIKVDNEMTGDNAPVRIEGEITLNTIFQSLKGTTGLPSPDEVIEIEGAST